MAHFDMGNALRGKGQVEEAITCFRKSIELDPKYAPAHTNLGNALQGKGQVEEAIACYRKAIELDPKLVPAHISIGDALGARGQVEEAIACYRKAIELAPKLAGAQNNLGNLLRGKGQLDEAITCYRKAIELDPKDARPQYNLGNALSAKDQVEEAIACYRKAIELNPKGAGAHVSIGDALSARGQVEEAIACYRKAIALDPKLAGALNSLGNLLSGKGQLDEAITCYRKAIALDPKDAGARAGLEYAQSLAAARDRLPAYKDGSYTPGSNEERAGLAEWCRIQKLHGTSTRLYAEAFAADPKLADDLKAARRYKAACSAALAAARQGEDTGNLDEQQRTRLRKQAVDWLRADLTLRTQQLKSGTPADRNAVRQAVRQWQQAPDLAGIRNPAALAQLTEAERNEAEALWAEVQALLDRTQKSAP
jgi:tetratricopeptide (TPR) repeat protein